ncbi:hypothetical protein QFC22_002979 [Naganishia vaughanmartiniae]|uniref:Uncharacterized protein n=1 Tax=Naganishia vaughanmartiniae TaxID=1424756 RepID=A0ACC2X8X5_9TREE|nr:hypothetical protein QFC22_002979 [Naganishia vaughanmartiniae]
MASLLDANLYTLLIRPSPTDPKNLTQLIEPSRGTEVRYLRYRGRPDTSERTPSSSRHDSGTEEDPTRAFGGYDASLVDAYTGVRLASCSSSQPSHKAKSRRLELHNPDMAIPFEFSGGLRQLKWTRPTFGSDYVCSIDRKPDPSVQVCIARPPSKGKDGVIQLLDYNLARFDFQDLKGLELAMYMSLLAIMDAAEDKVSYKKDNSPQGPSRTVSTKRVANAAPSPIPSQPVTTTDPELLNLEALNFNADPNEMYIPASAPSEQYISRCVDMLGDDSMLFVILRSASPQAVRKVIEIVDGAKSMSTNPILSDGNEVLTDPVRLDREKKYSPPQNITIYLSKIELPDLQPKSNSSNASAPSVINGKPANASSRLPALSAPDRLPSQAHPARVASPSHSAATPSGRTQHQAGGSGGVGLADNSGNAKSTSRIGRLFRSKS